MTPSMAAIIEEAQARGLTVAPSGWRNLMVITSRRAAVRMQGTVTGRTSHLAVQLAGDKQAVKSLLQVRGLPTCPGGLAWTANEAVAIAERLGAPVAVKPNFGKQSEAVRTGLVGAGAVTRAFNLAESEGGVVIERSHAGRDLRLLVVNGRTVAVVERIAPSIIGDSRQTVAELIGALNADSRRGPGHERVLTRVEPDEDVREMLASQGLDFGSVVEANRRVRLRWSAGLSGGAVAIDRTLEAHPSLLALAAQAAGAVGLDIAGVDVMVERLDAPWESAQAEILEVNASPGLRGHLFPFEGSPRNVAADIIDYLFPGTAPRDRP